MALTRRAALSCRHRGIRTRVVVFSLLRHPESPACVPARSQSDSAYQGSRSALRSRVIFIAAEAGGSTFPT
jgi:hypothetical protein